MFSIPYSIVYTKRRTVGLQVTSKAELIVRAPKNISSKQIVNILNQKEGWINSKIQQIKSQITQPKLIISQEEKKLKLNSAEVLFTQRLIYWSQIMNLKFTKLRLSDAKTRWGSCSSKNSISLNRRLALFPLEILDYVVIHEIAHIQQKNHSKKFWDLVNKYDPNWKLHRLELKEKQYLINF